MSSMRRFGEPEDLACGTPGRTGRADSTGDFEKAVPTCVAWRAIEDEIPGFLEDGIDGGTGRQKLGHHLTPRDEVDLGDEGDIQQKTGRAGQRRRRFVEDDHGGAPQGDIEGGGAGGDEC